MASTKVPGDLKVNYDRKGATVSEAIGYGMLLAVYLAGADANVRTYFNGLNRFGKRYSSSHKREDSNMLFGNAPPNESYRILAATNAAQPLSDWAALTNSLATDGVSRFTDFQASNYQRRFYRLQSPYKHRNINI